MYEKGEKGIALIILGNILNLVHVCFSGSETSNFGKFSSGVLISLSIGCNLVGIILLVSNMSKKDDKEQKDKNDKKG